MEIHSVGIQHKLTVDGMDTARLASITNKAYVHTLNTHTIQSKVNYCALIHLLEILDTLMHDLEGTVNVSSKKLRINVDKGVIHPCLVPLEPVSSSKPQVLKRLKLSCQLANLVILHEKTPE